VQRHVESPPAAARCSSGQGQCPAQISEEYDWIKALVRELRKSNETLRLVSKRSFKTVSSIRPMAVLPAGLQGWVGHCR
jgi:hypothetical protein